MLRRSLILAFAQLPRPLDERGELTVWFGDLAAHLTQDSPGEFLAAFDRAMPRRSELEAGVHALLKVNAVASIADLREIKGEGEERKVSVDWILTLHPRQDGAPVSRRRRVLQFQLRRRKKKGWVAAGIDEPSFFAP